MLKSKCYPSTNLIQRQKGSIIISVVSVCVCLISYILIRNPNKFFLYICENSFLEYNANNYMQCNKDSDILHFQYQVNWDSATTGSVEGQSSSVYRIRKGMRQEYSNYDSRTHRIQREMNFAPRHATSLTNGHAE